MWPLLIGGGVSLLGSLLAKGQADRAAGQTDTQLALASREQNYRMARQALLDPIFKELLARTLFRSRNAPMFGGSEGAGPFAALRAASNPGANQPQLPMLPPPMRIGEEPVAPTASPAYAPSWSGGAAGPTERELPMDLR